MIIMDSDILEKLSDLEHRQWCEWSGSVSKDIFSLITILDRFEDDLPELKTSWLVGIIYM